MRVIALLFLIQTTANAFFSINYSAEESHPALMTSPSVFKEVPTAEHVADIYARLSGLPPLLREGLTIAVIRDIEIGEFVYTSVNSKERYHFFCRGREHARRRHPSSDIKTSYSTRSFWRK